LQSEQNWPLLTVSRGFFDSALIAGKKAEGKIGSLKNSYLSQFAYKKNMFVLKFYEHIGAQLKL
jgi:hypothetical protein